MVVCGFGEVGVVRERHIVRDCTVINYSIVLLIMLQQKKGSTKI